MSDLLRALMSGQPVDWWDYGKEQFGEGVGRLKKAEDYLQGLAGDAASKAMEAPRSPGSEIAKKLLELEVESRSREPQKIEAFRGTPSPSIAPDLPDIDELVSKMRPNQDIGELMDRVSGEEKTQQTVAYKAPGEPMQGLSIFGEKQYPGLGEGMTIIKTPDISEVAAETREMRQDAEPTPKKKGFFGRLKDEFKEATGDDPDTPIDERKAFMQGASRAAMAMGRDPRGASIGFGLGAWGAGRDEALQEMREELRAQQEHDDARLMSGLERQMADRQVSSADQALDEARYQFGRTQLDDERADDLRANMMSALVAVNPELAQQIAGQDVPPEVLSQLVTASLGQYTPVTPSEELESETRLGVADRAASAQRAYYDSMRGRQVSPISQQALAFVSSFPEEQRQGVMQQIQPLLAKYELSPEGPLKDAAEAELMGILTSGM